jgi:hypothetical protein
MEDEMEMDSAENSSSMMYQAFKVEVNVKSINNVMMPATGEIIISIKDGKRLNQL